MQVWWFGTVLNNVCVTSWIESCDGRGWPPRLISRFEIQGHTVGLTANVSRTDFEMAKRTVTQKKSKLKEERLCTFHWSHWRRVVLLVSAVPSDATFSACTGVDLCTIQDTSVTSCSFPQYDLTKSEHTQFFFASCVWRFPCLPSANKHLKSLSKHTSISYSLNLLHPEQRGID